MKYKIFYILLLTFVITQAENNEPEKEDGIYILTEQNYSDIISQNDFVLVLFYAPWCDHSKKLLAEYKKVQIQIVEEKLPVILGKVDCKQQKELGIKYQIEAFPSLRYFIDGNLDLPHKYNSGRKHYNIVNWIKKQKGMYTELLKTHDQLQKHIKKSDVTLIYYGINEQEEKFNIFTKIAQKYSDIQFGHVFDSAIRQKENALALNLVLYKSFDEGRNDFTENQFNEQTISNFINEYSLPLVIPFDDKAVEKVFEEQLPTLFLFSNGQTQQSIQAEQTFYEAAKINKGKVLFTVTKQNDGFGNFYKLIQLMDLDSQNVPLILLFRNTNEVQNFQFNQKITVKNISSFVQAYIDGHLQKHNNLNNFNIVNFDNSLLSLQKDVVVTFINSDKNESELLIYKEVIDKINQKYPDKFIFAKNFYENGQNPYIRLYKKGQNNQFIQFEGEFDQENISDFILTNTMNQQQNKKSEL